MLLSRRIYDIIWYCKSQQGVEAPFPEFLSSTLRSSLLRNKMSSKMWLALEEDLQQEDDSPLEQQHMKALLHDLFQGEEATVVYRGCESSLFEPWTL